MIIAIDAMGGDYAPRAVLEGCALALKELPDTVQLNLFGDAAKINELMKELNIPQTRVTVTATTEVVNCDESPTMAIRKKKDSSLVRAISAVAAGEADCVLSAGSTGALLTGATLIIKRQKNVKRPALATVMPTAKQGAVMLIDCGANTDSKPQYLQQFALMGTAYMQKLMNVAAPRVGLLNNGAESEKGNELTKTTYPLLAGMDIRFAGNCEARDVLSGDFDVVVCDGFDGNIVLKGTEGAAAFMMSMLKEKLLGSFRGKIGAAIAKPAFRSLKRTLDYTEYGGAPLLGVAGGVIKAHGSSNGKAFSCAIRQAYRLIDTEVIRLVGESIAAMPDED